MIDLSNWDFFNRLTRCSACGSRRLEINTALSSVINIYWGLFCPMFRRIASCPQRYRRSRGHCWALTFMWSTALWITPMWELFSSSKMLSAFCSRSWRFGTGGEYSFCWTTWCYVDGKHNIMADLHKPMKEKVAWGQVRRIWSPWRSTNTPVKVNLD